MHMRPLTYLSIAEIGQLLVAQDKEPRSDPSGIQRRAVPGELLEFTMGRVDRQFKEYVVLRTLSHEPLFTNYSTLSQEEVSETTENVSSPTSPTTTYPGNTQTNQNRSGGGTNELGPEATAILTQVAALQAVVLSLQEQRARERERIGDSVEIGVAPPPQYSRTP